MKWMYLLPLLAVILTTTTLTVSLLSEQYWDDYSGRAETGIRETIGLPSIAVGTSYSGTRNPTLEVFCTSLYDSPGGYCYSAAANFIANPLEDPEVFASLPGFNNTKVSDIVQEA